MTTRADARTITERREARHSDVAMSFTTNPLTGELAVVTNAESVKQSIVGLVLTRPGERPFGSTRIGSRVYRMLFEPVDDVTSGMLQTEIEQTVENYEPRAQLIQVSVTPHEAQLLYVVTIVFRLVDDPAPVTLTIELDRVR